MFATYELLADD